MRSWLHQGALALHFGVLAAVFAFSAATALAQETPAPTAPPAADALSYPFAGEIVGDSVNLRAGFNENYMKLKALDAGEKVVVLGEQAGWYQVHVPSTFSGWISKQFVDVGSDGFGTVNGNRVSLRPSASTRHLPVGYVNTGDKLWVVGAEAEWVQVVAPPHMPAWVHSRYVKPLGPVDSHREAIAKAEEAALAGWREKRGEAQKDIASREAETALNKKFEAAEAELKVQSQAATPDVAALIPVYEEIANGAKDPLVAQGAKFRLEQLKNQEEFNKKIRDSRNIIAELDRELKQNEERYLATIEKMRHSVEAKEPDDRKVGWVSSVFTLDLTKGFPAYALTKGGSNLYYLESTKYNLKDFVGKHVIVRGDLKERTGLELSILVVRSIEIVADGT